MKEWRLKLTYKLILFMFFSVSPFFLFGLLKKNELKIELYIEIYFFQILIFLVSYFIFEVRIRNFYKKLVKKTVFLNEKYHIDNTNYLKGLSLDTFNGFEYFFNEEVDKVFKELGFYKTKYIHDSTQKGTEMAMDRERFDKKMKKYELKKEVLEYSKTILSKTSEFIIDYKENSHDFNDFFEELLFYIDNHFDIDNLLVGEKKDGNYKLHYKLSTEINSKYNYEELELMDSNVYMNHRINEFYDCDIIFILEHQNMKIGFIMFNLRKTEFLKHQEVQSIIKQQYSILLLILEEHFKTRLNNKNSESLNEEITNLKLQLEETNSNLEVHLEQMSNMYEEIVTLYEVGKKIGKIYDKKSIEKTILNTLLEITNTEFGLIYEYFNDEIRITKIENLKDKDLIKELREETVNQHIMFQMRKIKKALIVNEVQKVENFNELSLKIKNTIENFVETPIFFNEEIKGGVILFNKDDEYTAANVNLLTSLINQMSIAVQNIDYFKNEIERQKEEEQLKIAASIQAGLFPQEMPNFEKVSVSGYNVPAKVIGGDYYDLLKISDNDLIGIVADVSGKGIPASLLVSMVRTIFRMIVEELKEFSPEVILNRINAVLLKENIGGRFITAICFAYNQEKETLEFSSAGHDPLIFYNNKKNSFEKYGSDSLVLGVMEEIYTKKEIKFSKDDIAIFYTDGVVEARKENGEFYEVEKFLKSIENKKYCNAGEMVEGIYRDIKTFTEEAKQNDDITILVIKGEK